ncbi:unnamed protein product [Darwinula stevensoni]|uniref:Uncharacterized protein n=1 Tax=Darwinula stevensoni TaxID=69355 RepID=A0A7R8X6Q9_9CRUS|nr:unnamed protein product [Darwinula stevensoni]CAG0879712.1 unnamed protein product [Darwinula stevensoni]
MLLLPALWQLVGVLGMMEAVSAARHSVLVSRGGRAIADYAIGSSKPQLLDRDYLSPTSSHGFAFGKDLDSRRRFPGSFIENFNYDFSNILDEDVSALEPSPVSGPGVRASPGVPAHIARHFTPPEVLPPSFDVDPDPYYEPYDPAIIGSLLQSGPSFERLDHEGLIRRHTKRRAENGLPPILLGSIRPGFPFFRRFY